MASKTTLQAVDDPSLTFDPIKVGGDVVLAQHAEVIRALGKRVVHDVIEIGRRLTDAKARCGHGNWLPWLEREFGWSDSTALRYMQAHQFATDKSVTVTDLSLKSLYLLAAPSTPEAARDEVIERSEAGEHLTPAQIKETIDKAVNAEIEAKLQTVRAEADEREQLGFPYRPRWRSVSLPRGLRQLHPDPPGRCNPCQPSTRQSDR